MTTPFEDLTNDFQEHGNVLFEEIYDFMLDAVVDYEGPTREEFCDYHLALLYATTVNNVDDDIQVTINFIANSTPQNVHIAIYSWDGTFNEVAPNVRVANWALIEAYDIDHASSNSLTFPIAYETAYTMECSILCGVAIITENDVALTNASLASYSPASVEMTATFPATQSIQLPTPTNLHATNITSTGAELHWNRVENATGYKVDYRIHGDTLWQQTTSN